MNSRYKEMESIAHMSGQDSASNAPLAYPYSSPAGNEYPVIAYNNDLVNLIDHPIENVNVEEVIPETLDYIQSCGFNVTLLIWNKKPDNWNNILRTYFTEASVRGLRTVLDLTNIPIPVVEQEYVNKSGSSSSKVTAGISYDPTLDSYAAELNRYNDVDNLWGFNLMRYPEFLNWGYDCVTAPVGTSGLASPGDLIEAYRVFMQNVNRHTALFHLAVSTEKKYIGDEIYGSTSSDKVRFERYLNAFIDRLDPTLLSMELFPITKSETAPYYAISDTYYYLMESMGKMSAERGVPFWMYMLCVEYNIYRDGSTVLEAEYPFPTAGILRFQAMNALAFGFQGLVFWAFALPENVMQEDTEGNEIYKEEFIDAPYTDEGISDLYRNCMDVIQEIKFYGRHLLGARFIQAKHVYGPLSTGSFSETETLTTYMGGIANATADGRGFVVTQLNKGNVDKYMVFASHDPENEQEITITLAAGINWDEIVMLDRSADVSGNSVAGRTTVEQTITRRLKPGGIILIHYTLK